VACQIVISYNRLDQTELTLNSDRLSTVWAPSPFGLLSALHIFTVLDLLQHGTGKILGFPVVPIFANVQVNSLAGAGGLIELIGGTLFTVGLFTRPVAFVLSGFTADARTPISLRTPAEDSIRC